MTKNRDRLVYWISTGLVSAVMVFSVLSFTFYDRFPFPNGTEGAFAHLGLPSWFKAELTVAKSLGLLALLTPGLPWRLKEGAYFGFGLTLLSASIAHLARGDARLSVLYVIDPLVFLGLLIVSWRYARRIPVPQPGAVERQRSIREPARAG